MKKFIRYLSHPELIGDIIIRNLYFIFPDSLYLKLRYFLKVGKKLNLKNPKSFTEKLQWLKLYNKKPEYTLMVDKVGVKEYVAKKIGKEHIIPTIGVYNSADEIPWDALPKQFVLKTTHGGGGSGVVICKEKNNLDIVNAKKRLIRSFKTDIAKKLKEWPYKNVPKKIIAEEYITNGIDKDLPDFKWYCFNGEPKYCQVIRNRNSNKTIDFYDKDWNHQDFTGLNPTKEHVFKPVPKPKNLEEHIKIAKELSRDIPFVRVDLYEANDKTYFGELTFFPASGFGKFKPEEWNEKIGNLINLPTQTGGGLRY